MAKRPDPGDSTQPLSASQVVAATPKPPKAPARPIAPGDQSIAWRGTVVGADEFSPAKKKSGGAKWVVLGLLGVAGAGGATYALWPSGGKPAPAKLDASGSAMSGSAMAPPVAIDAAPIDAAPIDAAPAVDAAAPDDAAAAARDAGVADKKPPAKKPGPKKKPPPKKRGH